MESELRKKNVYDKLTFMDDDLNNSINYLFNNYKKQYSESTLRLIVVDALLKSTTLENPSITYKEFENNYKSIMRSISGLSSDNIHDMLVNDISDLLRKKIDKGLKRAKEINKKLSLLVARSDYKIIKNELKSSLKTSQPEPKSKSPIKTELSKDVLNFEKSLFNEKEINKLNYILKSMADTFKKTNMPQSQLETEQKLLLVYIYFLPDNTDDRKKLLSRPRLMDGLFDMLKESELSSPGLSLSFLETIVKAGIPLDEDEIYAFDNNAIRNAKDDDIKRIESNYLKSNEKVTPYGRLGFLISSSPALIYNCNGDINLFNTRIFGGQLTEVSTSYDLGDLTDHYNSIHSIYPNIDITKFIDILEYINTNLQNNYDPHDLNFEDDFDAEIINYGREKLGLSGDALIDWERAWSDTRDYFMDAHHDGMDAYQFMNNEVSVIATENIINLDILGITGTDDLLLDRYSKSGDLVNAIRIFYNTSVPFVSLRSEYFMLSNSGQIYNDALSLTDVFLSMPPDKIKKFINGERYYTPFGEENLEYTWDGYLVLRLKERFRRMFYVRLVGPPNIEVNVHEVRNYRSPFGVARVGIPQYAKNSINVSSLNMYSTGQTIVEVVETDENGNQVIKAYQAEEINYEQVAIPDNVSIFGALDDIYVLVPTGDGKYKSVKLNYALNEPGETYMRLEKGSSGQVVGRAEKHETKQQTYSRVTGTGSIHAGASEYAYGHGGTRGAGAGGAGENVVAGGEPTGYNQYYTGIDLSKFEASNVGESEISYSSQTANVEAGAEKPRIRLSGGVGGLSWVRRLYLKGDYSDQFNNDLRLYESMDAFGQLTAMDMWIAQWRRIYNSTYSRTDFILNPGLGRPVFNGILQTAGLGTGVWYYSGSRHMIGRGLGKSITRADMEVILPSRWEYLSKSFGYGIWGAGGLYSDMGSLPSAERFAGFGGGARLGRLSRLQTYSVYGEKGKLKLTEGKEVPSEKQFAAGMNLVVDNKNNGFSAEYGNWGDMTGASPQWHGGVLSVNTNPARVVTGWFEPHGGSEGFGGFQLRVPKLLYVVSQVNKRDKELEVKTGIGVKNEIDLSLTTLKDKLSGSERYNLGLRVNLDHNTFVGGEVVTDSGALDHSILGIVSNSGIPIGSDIHLLKAGLGYSNIDNSLLTTIDLTAWNRARLTAKVSPTYSGLSLAYDFTPLDNQAITSMSWKPDEYSGPYSFGVSFLNNRWGSVSIDWTKGEGLLRGMPEYPNQLYIGERFYPAKTEHYGFYEYGIHRRVNDEESFIFFGGIPEYSEFGLGLDWRFSNGYASGRIGCYWDRDTDVKKKGLRFSITVYYSPK
ncbi:hypothetical protein J7J26_03700 [Candidatus Micrarchaeota archaeon]|nr:hypothetical protein [Candidatus Micrarchaeota archaeon]